MVRRGRIHSGHTKVEEDEPGAKGFWDLDGDGEWVSEEVGRFRSGMNHSIIAGAAVFFLFLYRVFLIPFHTERRSFRAFVGSLGLWFKRGQM